jgi:uncharacterized protein with GYD domain
MIKEVIMSTYVLLGRYSLDAIKGINAKRTRMAHDLATKYKGNLKSVYALCGKNDLLLITEFPGTSEALQFSVALTRQTGIAFSTSEAIPTDRFDQLMEKV